MQVRSGLDLETTAFAVGVGDGKSLSHHAQAVGAEAARKHGDWRATFAHLSLTLALRCPKLNVPIAFQPANHLALSPGPNTSAAGGVSGACAALGWARHLEGQGLLRRRWLAQAGTHAVCGGDERVEADRHTVRGQGGVGPPLL